MKTRTIHRLALTVALLGALLAACTGEPEEGSEPAEETAEAAVVYTCPMHPEVVEQEPGACPVCSMDLVPGEAHAGHAHAPSGERAGESAEEGEIAY